MASSSATVWEYVAPADRETLVSGILAWLLDSEADHGLGTMILGRVLDEIGLKVPQPERVRVEAEARGGHNRRFDILLTTAEGQTIVFEVKCKTSGSVKELDKYAKHADRVLRIGFAEWNYPDLTQAERERYPLVKLSDMAEFVDATKEGCPNSAAAFVRGFVEHLRREYDLFRAMHDYFIEESRSQPPTIPTRNRYSGRQLNRLYWLWFRERLQLEQPTKLKWEISSERSGVWCSTYQTPTSVAAGRHVNLLVGGCAPAGPFRFHIHLEIRNKRCVVRTAGEEVGEEVGVLKVVVREGLDDEVASGLLQQAKLCEEQFAVRGFRVPGRRGRGGGPFTLLQRPLTIQDLRYSHLTEIVQPLLDHSGTD
ncbi:MAG TPA: PD-(D/E)XK nuclease family protein [Candidatus Krumholzibacteria bacterium]|nr:PD-(D/E)XK nuclease family protein [Candidatus Krumholzibacteria bacterium]